MFIMDRTFVILRHTFFETIVQPIYTLLLAIGCVILIVFGMLPFCTFGEDTVMYKIVGFDVIRMLVLIATLFATSKSIYEEIEDRTMLTLMSKPVSRFQVLFGKFLGIFSASGLMFIVMALVMGFALWWRIPGDYGIRSASLMSDDIAELASQRHYHIQSLIPSIVLDWMQVGVLAAIGVMLSVRVSLVVNLPVVILIYILCNLTRFLYPLGEAPFLLKSFAHVVSSVFPSLDLFDLREELAQTRMEMSVAWGYVAQSLVYMAFYVTFVLSLGLWLFQRRELGGAEG